MIDEQERVKIILAIHKSCSIIINGTSMEPVIHNGDMVEIRQSDLYKSGDILIFSYKDEGILAHRCIKVADGRYFCKGDNSFRLEDITKDQILGKIELSEDPNGTENFIEASFSISRLFSRCGYDKDKTIEHEEYRKYKEKYLDRKK